MPSLFTIVASVGCLLVTLQVLFEYYEGRLPLHYSRAVGALFPELANADMAAARQRIKMDHGVDIVYDGNGNERFDRLRYGAEPGAVVIGYPAKGGLYVLEKASSVEVEFLGFDRFDTEAKGDADTEEEFCNKMRQMGAVWWEKEQDYVMSWIEVPSPRHAKTYTIVGWPAGGGVWVLTATDRSGTSAGVIHNAHTMEERCKVIEKLGGKFYENPKDCPDLDLP